MKKSVIEAYNGIGKEKVLAGKREVDEPETLEEARKIDSDEDILEYYWSSKTIEIQRQIRAGTTMSAKQQLAALDAYVKANPESEVAKTLALLREQMGGKKVEETPPTPPATPEAPKEELKKEETPTETPATPARNRNRR